MIKMDDRTFPEIITKEISDTEYMLYNEHRAWRALELEWYVKGLAKALEMYYMYGFDRIGDNRYA